MTFQTTSSFLQYLHAKKTLDDRSLNRHVYGILARRMAKQNLITPPAVLEVGSGTGSMFTRLVEWGLLRSGSYTLLDADRDLAAHADAYLQGWAWEWDYQFIIVDETHRKVSRREQTYDLQYLPARLEEFLTAAPQGSWDLIAAHAFLDLIDLESQLPKLAALVKPGGYLYFTLNYDGGTIFEPEAVLDQTIERLYHRSMDTRGGNGKSAGSSRTGRQLLSRLQDLEYPILAAGSSDWVVLAGPQGYTEEEVFFLNYILDTIQENLPPHPELDPGDLDRWLATRRAQIQSNELIYIAHQIDLLAERRSDLSRIATHVPIRLIRACSPHPRCANHAGAPFFMEVALLCGACGSWAGNPADGAYLSQDRVKS
jgi:SAM-dependent methyltransferase